MKVMSAIAATSANVHVQIRPFTGASVSTGLANERTYFLGKAASPNVPILSKDVRITIRGTFSAGGSGSAGLGIDVSPDSDSGHWANLASVSADFSSVYPLNAGECVRFTVRNGSAASVSVDGWLS